MSRGRSSKIALVAGLTIAGTSRHASAQQCDRVRLELSNDLGPEWREAAEQLRADLAGSEAPCVSATLLVEPASGDGAARLLATTPDGRHTERVLTNVAALVPTALGLVASLPPEPLTVASGATPPVANITHVDPEPEDVVATLPTEAMPQLWLGASAGARIAEPTLLGMVELETRLALEMNRWLVVGSFRYGTSFGESAVSTDDSYYEIVGGGGVGRRFSIGSSSLDVVLLPAISSASLDDNDDQQGPRGSARTAVRLGASFCWWMVFADGSRFSLTADTDVTPYGFFHDVRAEPSEPPFPAWTAGLRVGAAGRIL